MAGFVIYRVLRRRLPVVWARKLGPLPILLAITIGFSHLPDLDFLAGLFANDLVAFHNNVSHSLAFGIVVALGIGAIACLWMRSGFVQWFLVALICYEGHILMDYFTYGGGVKVFWPISMERYQSPLLLFYGLRWSEGLISPSHLKTLAGETVFILVVSMMLRVLSRVGVLDPWPNRNSRGRLRTGLRQPPSD